MSNPKIPKELDAIADLVLAYRPNPKTKAAKQRKRLAAKIAKVGKEIAQEEGEAERYVEERRESIHKGARRAPKRFRL
ncbi:MAG: hypothetical protein ACLPKB_22470 [Xanthobacteraceae bacterium]